LIWQQTWRVWLTRDVDLLRTSIQKLTGLHTTLSPTGDEMPDRAASITIPAICTRPSAAAKARGTLRNMAGGSVVYLVTVGSKLNETGFRSLREQPSYHEEYAASGSPLVGLETWYSSRARDDRCVLEWLATSFDSPFPGGAREIVLGHGELVRMRGRTFLVYVERVGAACNQESPERPSYDAAALATLNGLPADLRRAAVKRFLYLPYTRRAWENEFSRTTGFVQCRDGNVPRIRSTALQHDQGVLRLQFEVAVLNLFQDAWLPSPCMTLTWKLQAYDLEMLIACATFLSILPVDSGT
jgi:hypothetical protein